MKKIYTSIITATALFAGEGDNPDKNAPRLADNHLNGGQARMDLNEKDPLTLAIASLGTHNIDGINDYLNYVLSSDMGLSEKLSAIKNVSRVDPNYRKNFGYALNQLSKGMNDFNSFLVAKVLGDVNHSDYEDFTATCNTLSMGMDEANKVFLIKAIAKIPAYLYQDLINAINSHNNFFTYVSAEKFYNSIIEATKPGQPELSDTILMNIVNGYRPY